MVKKHLVIVAISLVILFLFLFAYSVIAEQQYKCPSNLLPDECLKWALDQTGQKAGFNSIPEVVASDSGIIAEKIGTIISYILTFLGIIFLVITIYSGIQWMTAGGSEDKVKTARGRLINATIGIIIVMSAYAITYFVVSSIQSSTIPAQNASLYPAGTPCTQVVETGYEFQCATAEGCNNWGGQQLYMYVCDNAGEICCKTSIGPPPTPACIPTVCNQTCFPNPGQCIGNNCQCGGGGPP